MILIAYLFDSLGPEHVTAGGEQRMEQGYNLAGEGAGNLATNEGTHGVRAQDILVLLVTEGRLYSY